MLEYYIYNTPLFVLRDPPASVDVPMFCQEVEEYLSQNLLKGVEVVYIGDFEELQDKNAAFTHGAIYMTAREPTNFDMLENFIHEVAHSLEDQHGLYIYDQKLKSEFLGKRVTLKRMLVSRGYITDPNLYAETEYNKEFDRFLADEVGYPTLVSLTMGLFVSPYGATSLGEYFANGFEKYFLTDPTQLESVSPVLYQKIEEVINDEA